MENQRLRQLLFYERQIKGHPDKYPPFRQLMTPYGWLPVKDLLIKIEEDIEAQKTFLVGSDKQSNGNE